ncbi:hypothetical protein [Microbacterium aerolatum]|uniref:Uncharacterized protein n=1 Tax=Microbacterium aerolatum TaxID=153731 RepID=A0A511AEX5_9MICO|nr:hypothetical protein [Microbacterium aerolatum]GEK86576.1 hypothetical protein MAE01_17520 [Microbacterium aerolatum]GGB18004.1 hypothetical protein GCM10007198_05700 [Microbacterium aerolatum]
MLRLPVRRFGDLKDQLLIMRLIITVALSLLLLFGMATTSHSDAEGITPAQFTSSGVVDFADSAEIPDLGSTQPFAISDGSNALLGAAVCALGILCGLTAIVLLLRPLWTPRMSHVLCAKRSAIPPLGAFGARTHTTALSLIHLGVSRT